MSRPGALRSRVAVFICAALVTSLVIPGFTQLAPISPEQTLPQDARVRVAVGSCSDASGADMDGLGESLERALRRSLADQPGLRLVRAASGKPDRVLAARISKVSLAKGGGSAVQVMGESTNAETGSTAYRTTVTGEGVGRPGEGKVASAERALTIAADELVAQVARAEELRVHVIGTPKPGVVIIDRGSSDGITLGTELEVLQGRRVTGNIRVDKVNSNTATGRLFDVVAGESVDAGDRLRITSIPPAPVKAKSKKKGKNKTAMIVGIILIGGIIAALASGGSSGGGGAGNARITATAADPSIPADGVSSTTVNVTVADQNGNPFPDGTVVQFTSNLGLVVPAQAQLQTGVAQATLVAGNVPGTATVTVTVSGQQANVDVVFTQSASSVVPTGLTVLVAQTEIAADGITTSDITAIVGDANNNPVPDGTEVTFVTSLGLISPGTATTGQGVAQATLRSATAPGTATVTVTVGNLTQQVQVEFIASGAGQTKTIFLARSAAQAPADGTSTVTLTATVKNASNNPAQDGTLVNFTSTAGLIFPAQAATSNGIATATLRSDITPGQAMVTAKVGTAIAQVTVDFIAGGGGDIATIFVTRAPSEIDGDGVSTAEVAATVRDSLNNPAPDGTPVLFQTTRGIITPAVAYTVSGNAEATLRSEPTSTDVTATITVSAGNQQAVVTVKFTGTGGGPTSITLTADRTNIPADGQSTTTLRVLLLDPTGQPVGRTTVNLTTSAGQLKVPGRTAWGATASATTNAQGVLEALIRSTAAPGAATITATAPSITTDTAAATVAFTALIITSVTADPASVPVGGNKSSKVSATVVDTIGNPAPDGTVVEFLIVNQGTLPGASITGSTTTSGGIATAIFRSGTNVGTARIRVEVPSSGAVNDQTIIGITSGPAALITGSASRFVASSRVLAPGDPTVITCLVSDQFDNPVEDGTAVRFDVTPDTGAVITGTSVTSGGFASANLFPTGFVGDITVIASTTGSGGATIDNSASPLVIHMGGAPVLVQIISPNAGAYAPGSPFKLYTDADQTIVVRLTDSSGGPADPLAEVTFQVSRGVVSPDPATITAPLAGTATAALQSDQPSDVGTTETLVAVSEGVPSAPLYYVVEVNLAP